MHFAPIHISCIFILRQYSERKSANKSMESIISGMYFVQIHMNATRFLVHELFKNICDKDTEYPDKPIIPPEARRKKTRSKSSVIHDTDDMVKFVMHEIKIYDLSIHCLYIIRLK